MAPSYALDARRGSASSKDFFSCWAIGLLPLESMRNHGFPAFAVGILTYMVPLTRRTSIVSPAAPMLILRSI